MAGLLTYGRDAFSASSPARPSRTYFQWPHDPKAMLAGQITVHSCGGSAGFDPQDRTGFPFHPPFGGTITLFPIAAILECQKPCRALT